jgi:hypothetical protein
VNNIVTKTVNHYGDHDTKDDTIFHTPFVAKTGSVSKPDSLRRGKPLTQPITSTNQCRRSDPNNIFANPNITSVGSMIHPPCKLAANEYTDAFDTFTRNDEDDLFNTNARRQFYSVVDNNQSKFSQFLYGEH